jgi:hypothetical protein
MQVIRQAWNGKVGAICELNWDHEPLFGNFSWIDNWSYYIHVQYITRRFFGYVRCIALDLHVILPEIAALLCGVVVGWVPPPQECWYLVLLFQWKNEKKGTPLWTIEEPWKSRDGDGAVTWFEHFGLRFQPSGKADCPHPRDQMIWR